MKLSKILIIISLFLIACNHSAESTKYINTVDNNQINNGYPKRVNIFNGPSRAKLFIEIYLGSDGHEYYVEEESHVDDGWLHYPGCIKCLKKMIIFLTQFEKITKIVALLLLLVYINLRLPFRCRTRYEPYTYNIFY